MTNVSRTRDPAMDARPDRHSSDPEVLRAQVDRARERLGDTIEELAAKADVKARLRRRTMEARRRVSDARARPGRRRTRWIAVGVAAVAIGVAGVAVAAGREQRRQQQLPPLRRQWQRLCERR
jgi:anti-sigma-K factor RskA